MNEGIWKRFGTKEGLKHDYAYAVAVDKQGRVWVGHLNHGVSVFNGLVWKNYDVPYGPIGERIFKIAVCPTDGDVWLGTSAGLTRYSVSKETWTHYTRGGGPKVGPASRLSNERDSASVVAAGLPGAGETPALRSGLPANQINSIAFDAEGNIYVGTHCDGVAMASRAAEYQDWRRTPLYTATGLQSGMINDLLVASDGTLYAATDAGLAWSKDGGATWASRRGKDALQKKNAPAGSPLKTNPISAEAKDLLPEDYVTSLAEDSRGVVWLGFRQGGLLPWDGRTATPSTIAKPAAVDFVRTILPLPGNQMWVGSYGRGLSAIGDSPANQTTRASAPIRPFRLPVAAPVPDAAELKALLAEVQAVSAATFTNGSVLALEDDWRTQGQWLGRYGRFWSVLCANWSPRDDVWGAGWDVMYDARIGPNCTPGDSIRYWVHWLATDQNRCLEMSPTYLHSRVLKGYSTWDKDRRQSEWDDHGEAYLLTHDGPNVYCSLSIPAGLFYLSLYDVNKDGTYQHNRWRDYRISVRPHPGRASLDWRRGNTVSMGSFFDLVNFDEMPELASGRIVDFWGGAYKRFLVRGPTKLTIEVDRNHSHNTILAGVMLDLVDESPPPYFQTREQWEQTRVTSEAAAAQPAIIEAAPDAATAARQLAAALAAVRERNSAWWADNKRRCYLPLLRWQLTTPDPSHPGALATSFYELNLYLPWENQLLLRGLTTARKIERALRWDGVTRSYAGLGNQIVLAYLQAQSARTAAAQTEN